MSRDEDLLGSPAGSAMPLAISRVLCWQKIGCGPCWAAVGAAGAGWNVGRLAEECDDAVLPSPACSWWLQTARLGGRRRTQEKLWLHRAVGEDEKTKSNAI